MDLDENGQVDVVTDQKQPAPEVRFKYVYIPCDMSQPVEEVSITLHSVPFRICPAL